MLPNPISTDHAVLRTHLTPQLSEALGRNRARQTQVASLFELGRVFIKAEDGAYQEKTHLIWFQLLRYRPSRSSGQKSKR